MCLICQRYNFESKNVLGGLTKIQRGGEVSFEQADALATFWNEVTHNRNKIGNTNLTKLQREQMELANELVSRNTLSEFYEGCGAKLQHGELQNDRQSTEYNTMVRNYCAIIRETGANFEGVIKDVKTLIQRRLRQTRRWVGESVNKQWSSQG